MRRLHGFERRTAGQAATQGEYRSYETDANGSVVGLEDDDGDMPVADRYEYDPFGELQRTNAAGEPVAPVTERNGYENETALGLSAEARDNPFRYQGFYYDSGIKLYDMGARAYRPDASRFLTQDRYESSADDFNLGTDPLTQNRYAFAGGNPVNNVEWDGHWPNLRRGENRPSSAGKNSSSSGSSGSSGSSSGSGRPGRVGPPAAPRGSSFTGYTSPTGVRTGNAPAAPERAGEGKNDDCRSPLALRCRIAAGSSGGGVQPGVILRTIGNNVLTFHPYTAVPKVVHDVKRDVEEGDWGSVALRVVDSKIRGSGKVLNSGPARDVVRRITGGTPKSKPQPNSPLSRAESEGFTPPKVRRTPAGEVTNGRYTVSDIPQARHTTGSTTSDKSQFLFRVDADRTVLDAAAYADQAGLWVNNRAKVLIKNGPVGVHADTGELTSYLNVYRTKGGYVHGTPGSPP